MPRRYFSSTAVATTLASQTTNSATTITVTALTGYPANTPWTAIIDEGTASEEVVTVTNVAGTTLTVTRGADGTSGVSHNAGASFKHGVSARDFDEPNAFVNVLTTKGDLLTRTASADSRLGVGSNNQFLVADSAEATGMKWSAVTVAQVPTLSSVKVPSVDTNAQTDSYTLVLADAGKVVEMDKATAQTLTIPLNSSVAFPVGTKIDVIQTGAGEVTIAATSGVTLNSEGSKKKINAQWQAVTLVKRGADSWVLIGALKT